MNPRTKRNIESAGAWFVGAYSAELYTEFQRIKNEPIFKTELRQRIYADTKRYSEIRGIITRVNAVLQIVSRGELLEALQYVANSRLASSSDAVFARKAQDLHEKLTKFKQ